MKTLVTGGFGFIGSNLARMLLDQGHHVTVVDKISYASAPEWVLTNPNSRGPLFKQERFDLCDQHAVMSLFQNEDFDVVFHLAAESHVCNSIRGPIDFLNSNVIATYNILEAIRQTGTKTRLVHVSTDEVFGELNDGDPPFEAHTPYRPRSPYAATKAASDHLVKAWVETYGLDAVVTNCTNNYGPNQHEEKLIPRTIKRVLSNQSVTVYGTGKQIRNWLHVDDHCRGLILAAKQAKTGSSILFGSGYSFTNLDIMDQVVGMIREFVPDIEARFEFTNDRPTDDHRYAVNNITAVQLGWSPSRDHTGNLRMTVQWFIRRLTEGTGRTEHGSKEATEA